MILVNNAHQVTDNRTYDSFGNLISQTGTTKTPLGFQGKYYDQESGLNYFYHRYYNPTLGRFITFDPIKLNSEINLFKFVRNNPLSIVDPLGLKPICVPWISENTDWYFDKNPNLKEHISVLAVGINPANYSTCIWKKETKGISTRLTRPQKLCFGVAVCGKIIPFIISAGDWKEEQKESSEYEVVQTRGVSTASINNPKKMGGVWCQNPWSPFNWQYIESPKR